MNARVTITGLATLSALALAACTRDKGPAGPRTLIRADQVSDGPPVFGPWSAPVNLGPVVNSVYDDLLPEISRDGLSLYFRSDRPGGFGGADIWVSQRTSVNAAWGPPQNLGVNVNTIGVDQSPGLSPDGHRLFFDSDRPGGCGGRDLYVSRRQDARDDLGWEPAVNLGCTINTPVRESGPNYFEDDRTGAATLYFVREPGELGGADIYASSVGEDGTFGPGILVSEVSSPYTDRRPYVRRDGLEMFISSNRPGGLGGADLWVSTRATTQDVWSTPVNLGPPINTAFDDGTAAVSADGTTLYFYSNRPGGLGGQVFGADLYVSTRQRLK